MLIARRLSLFILVFSTSLGGLKLFAQTTEAVTCSQATLTRPKVGVAYRGKVAIDDYKFAAAIPLGLTGWGGVASHAPFHGFTIFLDHSMHSCILFEVHMRVDDAGGVFHPDSAKTLSLGQAKAWQSFSETGGIASIKTVFTFSHDGQIDDGEILLISPAAAQRSTVQVYQTFLNSVTFGGDGSR